MAWAERVVAASGFVWVPETAIRAETREFLLVRFPDYFDHHLVLATFRPDREPAEVIDDVLARAREFEEPELVWWVKLDAPPGMDELVQARGGVLDETLDVLALDLAPGLPDLGEHEVTLRWTTDERDPAARLRGAEGRVRWGRPARPAAAGRERPGGARRRAAAAAAGWSPTWTTRPSAPEASRSPTTWAGCGAARCSRSTAAGASTAPCSPPDSSTPCATAPRWPWSRAGWRPRDRSCAALASSRTGRRRSYRVPL